MKIAFFPCPSSQDIGRGPKLMEDRVTVTTVSEDPADAPAVNTALTNARHNNKPLIRASRAARML